MSLAPTVLQLRELIGRHKFRGRNEKVIQDGLELVFTKHHPIAFQRELILAKGSCIDFLFADGIGVEVKVDGGLTAVLRQLDRYASFEQVKHLLLVSALSRHRVGVPEELRGKPIEVIHLGYAL